MKRIVRSIGFGMLAAIFIATGAGSIVAQTAGCDDTEAMAAIRKKAEDNYGKNSTVKNAIEAGKEYLAKFGTCPGSEDFVKWINDSMPTWVEHAKKYENFAKMDALYKRFDTGINTEKYDDVYSAGKEILAIEPKNIHIMIPLGLVALTETYKKNYKYNDDAVRYGKMAIEDLKAGAEPKKDKDGKPVLNKAGQPAYSTWLLSKQDAIDELTYSVAYITFYPKNDKKTALPLFYELAQSNGKYKNDPLVYDAIANHYILEKIKLTEEIEALEKKGEELNSKTPPAGEVEKHNADVKQLLDARNAKIALFNGYAERALDALGRAQKVAPGVSPTEKTYKEELKKRIEALYKQRFYKDTTMAGMQAFMSKTLANPLPDPLSEVKPISDEPETTTSTTAPTTPANGKTSVATKPTKQ